MTWAELFATLPPFRPVSDFAARGFMWIEAKRLMECEARGEPDLPDPSMEYLWKVATTQSQKMQQEMDERTARLASLKEKT